ncbi:hypothetical protein [Niabella aquatica]
MNKQFLDSYCTGCILVAVLAGCGKNTQWVNKEDELLFNSIESVSRQPGFGNSDEMPQGTPFGLPKGLHFVTRTHHPFDPDLSKLKGNMNTFYVDINIVSDKAWAGGEVIFPQGLVLLNTAPSRIQNGMLIDREPVTVPPYSSSNDRDTTTVYLGVACMNAGKGIPWADNSGEDDRNYPIAKGMHRPYVVTTNKEVLKFLSLLKGKEHLRLTRHYNPREQFEEDYIEPEWLKPYSIIQKMFWKMTDGPGLTQSDLKELMKAIQK